VRRAIGLLLVVALALAGCGETPTLPFLPTPEPTPEQPRPVEISVVATVGGGPIADAEVSFDGRTVLTQDDGTVTLEALTGDAIEAAAPGHDPGRGEVPREGDVSIELRPNVASGTVTDPAGAPILGARVFVDGATTAAVTDDQGRYELPGVPEEATLIVKMPGYRLAEVEVTGDSSLAIDVALEPFEVRALYAPAAVFEGVGRLDELLAVIEATEVNAMVIDVKEVDGRLYYATDLPAAGEVGAIRETPVFDLAELLPMLEERGIYTIARMVVMKDNTLAAARPELAVRNTSTGEAWRDNIGGAWLDPSAPGVAEYIAAVAADIADHGFDEVQLDYIRWYSDGPFGVAETNLPNTQSVRLPAIRRVMRTVSAAFETRRAFLAADVFPIAFIVPDDQGIGQRPEVMMPYVDYFCPMVYPSHYGPGVFGHPVPNEAPYDVIDKTLEIMNGQAEGLPLVIRPWIQDFGYGSFRAYTAGDIHAEMQALADNGAGGWMIWNASARFTIAALAPPREGEDTGPTRLTAPPAEADASASPASSAVPSASDAPGGSGSASPAESASPSASP
jgi:hypothetical protein